MLLPTRRRLHSEEAPALVLWGVNGFLTVIGPALPRILGRALRFCAVLAHAAVCYLVWSGADLLRAERSGRMS